MCVTNPLWVIKTRLQTQHMGIQTKRNLGKAASPLYTGTLNAFIRISREEGLRGLYRSAHFPASQLSQGGLNAIIHMVYQWVYPCNGSMALLLL
jgi:hypothetical protein